MKGLLKNQFYGAIGSTMVLLIIFSVAGIGLIISGNPSVLTIYVLASPTAFAFNAVASIRKEAASKWNKYELTAPVRRKEIVKSRYIHHAVCVFTGILLSALFIGLTVVIHGNSFFYDVSRDPLTLFCIGTGIALLMGTLFYPGVYLLGTDKSEIIIITSLLGSIGITAGIIWLLNAAHGFHALSNPEFYLTLAIYMGIVIISFCLSYFLTTLIYRKKDC
mgnify:CR=1 FL=1